MKKYLESNTSLEDIKAAIRGIQKREDKRALYIFIAIVTAILVATLIAVVYLLKNKMNDGIQIGTILMKMIAVAQIKM